MFKIKSDQCNNHSHHKKNYKFPCPVCEKNCNKNQQSIQCSPCNNWVHCKCNGITKAEFDILEEEDNDIPFHCIFCNIKNNADIFPFGFLPKSELLDLHGIDMLSQLAMLPSFTVCSKLSKMPNLNDFDMDENLTYTINSKYYSLAEISKLNPVNESFFLFHLKRRSLSAHHDELTLLLSNLKFKFDVIGISETKEQSDKGFLSNVGIPGYNIHSQPTNSFAGGVALYIKSTLDYKIREDICMTKDEFEIICLEILSKKDKNTLCCCAYRHPNTDGQAFSDFINNTMQKIIKERKNIFFMGDFNLNLLNYETHDDTNDFLNSMISYSLLPYIFHPTRVTDCSSAVIDNIFSNITGCEPKGGNILCDISDHFPQFIVLEKSIVDYNACSFSKRDFSNFNENSFVQDYLSLDQVRTQDNNDTNVDNMFNLFYENLSNTVNKHVPTRKMTRKDIKLHIKPWINQKIVKLIKYRDRLKRKFKRRPTIENEYLYKKFRKRVVNELKASRAAYHQRYFQSHKDNMKKLWSGIRSIINVKQNCGFQVSQLMVEGSQINDPPKIASAFDQYFVNVPKQVDKEIHRTLKSPVDYLTSRIGNSFFLKPTNPSEIEAIILSFKNSKSVGPYSIPVKLLKILVKPVSNSFSEIVNASFGTGVYPTELKKSQSCGTPQKRSQR